MQQCNPQTERALADVMARLVPLADAPAGERLLAEQVVALGERRLLPEEEPAVIERIKRSPAARVELRHHYPARYAELLGDERPALSSGGGAKVLRFPLRPALAGAATFAAAAAITLFVWPYGPTSGGGFEQTPAGPGVLRSAASADAEQLVARPGQPIQLLMRQGEPSSFDRLRGAQSWGALFRVDHAGEASLVCTSQSGCGRADGTLSHLFRAPVEPGRANRFVFVSGPEGIAPADARAVAEVANAQGGGWPALDEVLKRAAATHGWSLHPQRPIVVGAP